MSCLLVLPQLCTNEFIQVTLLDDKDIGKNKSIDKTIDSLRMKFETNSVYRGVFLHSGGRPVLGVIGEEEYPVMASML